MASVAATAVETAAPRPTPPVAYRPLPPIVGPVSATDHDGDGDNDTGTILDTFA